ncbi:MAG: hypothetical protein KJ018_12990 [Burkholderiales bacterium]|nr:hypothetical protein [Burkholderiales bacterium]
MDANDRGEKTDVSVAETLDNDANDLRKFVERALDDFFPLSLVIAIVEAQGGDPIELLYGWLKRHRPDLAEKLREVTSQ